MHACCTNEPINNGIIVDVVISILQVDMGDELNPNMSEHFSMAARMNEKELLEAMTHLTEEEKARILEVMRRAESLESQAAQHGR